MKHTIDATNKKIGRIASQVAILLMGKDKSSFARNEVPKVEVTVINAKKLSIDERKLKEKKYSRYSGYPSGLKFETLDKVIKEKGEKEVLKRAIFGMLPKNKLRSKMIKNLKVEE